MARIVFDHLAETQNRLFAAAKPRPVEAALPAVTPPAPAPSAVVVSGPAAAPKKAQRPTLSLNGIVFSPGASYALINNKIVKEGDSIEGMKVIRIAQDSVELHDGDTAFKLSPSLKSF